MMLLKIMGAGVVSAAFCILFQVRGSSVVVAGLNGALGFLVFLVVPGAGMPVRLLFASAFMTIYAEAAARLQKAPTILFLSPALIPIVPGGGMFECALKALQGRRLEAAAQFGSVMLEAGAIAFGIILVSAMMQFVKGDNYLRKGHG